jgi:hypothetical protein
MVRIQRVANIADLTLGDLLTESTGTRPCDIRKSLVALPNYASVRFSDIPRLTEEHWLSLGEIVEYIMTNWTPVIRFLKDKRDLNITFA